MQPSDPARALSRRAGEILERLRRLRPRVHVLTSPVAAQRSADVLTATGAIPSMTTRVRDVVDFVRAADALVVNLGMLDAERELAARLAVGQAIRRRTPWLLDPVKLELSGARNTLTHELLAQSPWVVRLNRCEATALVGSSEPEVVAAWARRAGLVLAVSGPTDLVTDGRRTLEIGNGTALLDRLTATGCALSALTGAFLAVHADPFEAAAACTLVYGVAAEVAAFEAAGPGTLAARLLDSLYALTATLLHERARVR